MAKEIIYGQEVWKKIESGIDKVANAVKITVGPRGQNVILENGTNPVITNDGVTIAKNIQLEDPFENMGAQLMIEVASKANDVAGDGTTTATILAQSIFKKGLREVSVGANPMAINRGIRKAVDDIILELKKNSIKVEDRNTICQVASISANNDTSIGNVIADAMEKAGKDGVITVEESKTFDTTLEMVEGMQFDRGFISPYFANNPEGTEAILQNPWILVTDKKISSFKDILPLLERVAGSGRPILILADDVEGEALSTLVINKMRGTVQAVAVKAPEFGNTRKETLQDIAILTGAVYVSEDFGIKLENVGFEDCGSSKTVKVLKDSTTIIGGNGNLEKIRERFDSLKKVLEVTESENDKVQLKKRIAKLSSGVAVIYAGAATETELKEKKFRIEDALHATKAAVEEGVVCGGGLALIQAIQNLYNIKLTNSDEQIGYNIILASVSEPLRQIANNAGDVGDVVLNRIDSKNNIGFDANKLEYVNMIEAGIIDPLKITRSALQNAASVSGMLLTTGCMVVTKKEEKK